MTPPASTEPMYLISESELNKLFRFKELKNGDVKIWTGSTGTADDTLKSVELVKQIRARDPVQQASAPTNHLAIPCPKCGKWIFRANVDEGYTLFCSDDECGWKQKIVTQQAPVESGIKRTSELPKIIPPLPTGDTKDLKLWREYWEKHDAALIVQTQEDVLNKFCDLIWENPLTDSGVDSMNRIGEIIRSLRPEVKK